MVPEDDDKPNPLEDVKKGLGLLFRAAKTTAKRIPTGGLEGAVISGAKEVGRAVENVADTIEKELFKRDKASAKSEAKADDAEKKADDKDEPGGPRVGG
jgi:hypothetical protein